MATPHTQIREHRYISGWCAGAMHYRCEGSYAGTACRCSCHQQAAVTEQVAPRAGATLPRPEHDLPPRRAHPIAPRLSRPPRRRPGQVLTRLAREIAGVTSWPEEEQEEGDGDV